MTRKSSCVFAVLVFAMAFGACGDAVVDTALIDEAAVDVNVDEEEVNFATFCGTVTCPWTVPYNNCTGTYWEYLKWACQSSCGGHNWSGCQKYNSTSCTGSGYAAASVYCANSTAIKCRYHCYRH